MSDNASDDNVLAYALEHYRKQTLDADAIIHDLHITPDAFFTSLLSTLIEDCPPHVDDATRRNLQTAAQRYLWLHRC